MKTLKSAAIIIFFIFIMWVIGASFANYQGSRVHYWDFTIGEVKLRAEVVMSPEDQAKGLSGRKSLNSDEGMFFVFGQTGKHYFWMKDMNFPIDIIWIGENKEIIFIEKNARPEDFPKTYGPDENSKYVLEVVSGFSDKNNLKVGDNIFK